MKEPTREEWAENFLGEAHDALNRAAVKGRLCNRANEARLLIGQALTAAGQPAARGVLGRWPAPAIEKVKEAQMLLRDARWTSEADRAMYFCDDAVRLIEAGGKLRPKFACRAEDREVPVRFFGNAKVAHAGKGHGVPLDKPLLSPQAKADQSAATAEGDGNKPAASWKQRAEKHARGQRARRMKGSGY